MAGKTRWGLQPHLSNIVHLPLKDLRKLYPDYTDGTLKGKKSFWKTKIKKGEIPMPPPANYEQEPHQGQIPETGRLKNTWEVAAYDREEGGWVTTTLSSYEHPSDPMAGAEIFEAATPAKITPTKRKRAEQIGRTILVFGDSQIGYHRVYDQEGQDSLVPIHSEEALSVIEQVNAQIRPDEIVSLGDTIDLAELGRFDPQSDSFHRTLGPSFQRVHNLYAQFRADNPDANITEVDSNHNQRTQKAMMKRYPEWYGFTLPGEDYPMMSYYRLARLADLDINWIAGYGSAEYVYGEAYDKPPIVFKHGAHSSSSPGATVRKEAQQNPTVHVVRGHGHSHEHITTTDRDGNYLHYIQLGTSCSITGNTPSYKSSMDDFGNPVLTRENWQQQFMVIRDYDGHYQFDVVDIINGIAMYNGVTYDGNTEATS